MKRIAMAVVTLMVAASPVFAQSGPEAPPFTRELSLSGPRFGFTFLNDSIVQALKDERGIEVSNAISQFGWQFEKQFYSKQGGPTVLNEFVFLLGGMDQGVTIPSFNWLVGVRTHEGAEFGIGPNITPAGVALAMSAGITIRTGAINVPLNVAVVPSKNGVRVSMLTGFTLRR